MAVTNYSDPPRFAGFAVTATGKFAPKSDGTDALVLATTNVDSSGNPVGVGTTASPVVTSSAAPADRWFYAGVTGGITDTADVAIKAAAGASIKNYLVRIQAGNGSAVASEIVIKDGSTIIWRGYIPATSGQLNVAFDPPLQSTANTALNVAMITTATATRVSAQGYVGA